MEKIKFDYLLECLEQIDEMAKAPTKFGVLNNKYAEVAPILRELDPHAGSSTRGYLFNKTVIGLYNDITKEFEYTIPVINKEINALVHSIFKGVYPRSEDFDITTFEDIYPDSESDPHYDSAIRLAEAIVYSVYFPDFKSLSADEFAKLKLPTKIEKELMGIMDNISKSKSQAFRLDTLLQQRFDMINNPNDSDASVLGPLDLVKFLLNTTSVNDRAMTSAYEMLFVSNPRSSEINPDVKKRQDIISSQEFKDKLTIDLFRHYRLSDRHRSSTAMQAEELFLKAANISRSDYATLRNEVEPLIKELKNLNKIQRHAIKKRKDPNALSPTLKKYEETGELPEDIDIDDEKYDVNEYLETVLAIWGVDVRKNINSEFNPSKPPYINSISAPSVNLPRKAVNSITPKSFNLIKDLFDMFLNKYNEKGIAFTSDDFQTKVVDKIKALNTAPNETEVLQSIHDGLVGIDFGNLGDDDNQYEINGIEKRVVRAVFDKPENKDMFQKVKDVIKMQLQVLELNAANRLERVMAKMDKAMINDKPPVQQPVQQQQPTEEQPVQESYDATFHYMENQMQRDSKFKGDNSKYNDRGFKKPINYWHWMTK
jgi:hypothetical protein